jgi:hypothetical protein
MEWAPHTLRLSLPIEYSSSVPVEHRPDDFTLPVYSYQFDHDQLPTGKQVKINSYPAPTRYRLERAQNRALGTNRCWYIKKREHRICNRLVCEFNIYINNTLSILENLMGQVWGYCSVKIPGLLSKR